MASRSPARISRAEQNERNRAAILAAAREVFLERGYHATTVEAVATAAGLTIGAIYSRFAGKADLFLALLDERIRDRAEQFTGVGEAAARRSRRRGGVGPDAVIAEFGRRSADILRDDRDWSLLVIEFRVHAARDPEIGRRYADLHERAIASLVANIAAALPEEMAVPAPRLDALARAAMAWSAGGALARAAEGDRFGDALHAEVSRALGSTFLGTEDL